jgi:hypothetical protein
MDIGKFSRKDRRGWPRAWRKVHTAIAGAVLAGAAVVLLAGRLGVVATLLAAGLAGVVVGLAGGPLP